MVFDLLDERKAETSFALPRERRPGRSCAAARLLLFGACGVGVPGCKSKTIAFDPPPVPAILVTVAADFDMDAGLDGTFVESMGTAFQSAPWQSSFFDRNPDAVAALSALGARYVLVQTFESPLTAGTPDGGPWDYRAGAWDFRRLDQIVQPLLQLYKDAGSPEPIIQIYPPAWYAGDPYEPSDFADYCAAIVSYYNADGGLALADGSAMRSDAGPIRSWALWTDPNNNQFAPAGAQTPGPGGVGFAAMYRAATSRMLAVDTTLTLIGPEDNDCLDIGNFPRSASCDPSYFLPDFLMSLAGQADSGTIAPLHVLSLHMFPATEAIPPDVAGPSPPGSDEIVLSHVSIFASDIAQARQSLAAAGRGNAQVWVTSSQVNSDSPTDAGYSQNSAGNAPRSMVPYQADTRGTDAFITAWRPYMFSQLARSGNQALFQWQFTAGQCPSPTAGCSTSDASDTDPQNAEIDYSTGSTKLTYWVDKALAHKFQIGSRILNVTSAVPDVAPYSTYSTTTPIVDVLATKDQSEPVYVVMVVNLAREAATASSMVDGPGSAITVLVDVSLIVGSSDPSGWKVSELTIDGTTDRSRGPAEEGGIAVNALSAETGAFALPPITFLGYGVAFITICGPGVPICPPNGR